jgi:UDP-glucose 4-epimerase
MAHFVLVSSAAVYGEVAQRPIPEDAPLCPVSPYGVHKLQAEDLCRSYSRHFGVRTVVVRLFSVYGPGLRRQLLWDACEKLRSGSATFSGTGNEVRDWLHVKDAARLLAVAAAHASTECPVANGGYGMGRSVREVVATLAEDLGANATPCFTGARRSGDPKCYVADLTTAKSWGWQPAIEWRSGMRAYAEWYAAGAQR